MGKLSLGEFAKANPTQRSGGGAWITTIPEWPEILKEWNAGTVTPSQIVRWLIDDCGYDPSVATKHRVSYLSIKHTRKRNG